MTEEGGSGTRLVCPACGRAREAGGRFCPGCGLDYWRLAAGSTVESAGGPVRKGRFGRGRRPAFAPTPSASASFPIHSLSDSFMDQVRAADIVRVQGVVFRERIKQAN